MPAAMMSNKYHQIPSGIVPIADNIQPCLSCRATLFMFHTCSPHGMPLIVLHAWPQNIENISEDYLCRCEQGHVKSATWSNGGSIDGWGQGVAAVHL